jgi:hypothetical protein
LQEGLGIDRRPRARIDGVRRHDSAAVVVQSPEYNASGTVEVRGGTDAEASDWEVGFIQTVHSSSRKGDYLDAAGSHNRFFEARLPGPTRDGNPAAGAVEPWYDSLNANAVKSFTATDQSKDVTLWDRPGTGFPWKTPDGAGTLVKSFNKDLFGTWMIVRQKSSGNITYLNWATWEIDWAATFDFATKSGTSSGGGTRTGQGSGQGSGTPVLTNPVANDAATAGFVP